MWAGSALGVPPQGALYLERYANNFSPADTRAFTARERRYHRRGVVWEVSTLERICKCGRVVVDARGVGVRRSASGVVGLAGLATCGSVWSCPVCNAKVMSRRAMEIGAAVTAWEARGGSVGFVTLTMSHHEGQSLSMLWNALAAAWNRVTGGKAWISDKAGSGVGGWLRVVEVTLGPNGWHVHVHALFFLNPGQDAAERLDRLQASMFGRWSRSLVRAGLEAPRMIGQEAHIVKGAADVSLSEYFTKARDDATYGIGLELAHSQSKIARDGFATFTPWELLTMLDLADTEERYLMARDLWEEWENGSRGRRQIAWSKGLRDRLGLGVEVEDEAIAAEVVGDEADTVAYITSAGWASIRKEPVLIGRMLDVLANGGSSDLLRFLRTMRIEFEEV